MSAPLKHLQAAAVPFGWEEGRLLIGLVTAYRSRKWTLPKISVSADADAAETASNEALREGGFLTLAEREPLLVDVNSKGVETAYYPAEIHGVLDTWDANRTHSRKLVPVRNIEKYLQDRPALKAVRALAERLLDIKLLAPPKRTEDESVER